MTTGPGDAVAGQLAGAITARLAFTALRGTEAVTIDEVGATGILVTGNVSGASFNPAWTPGPYVANALFGGLDLWIHAWTYLVGPIAGAISGAVTYRRIVLAPVTTRQPVDGEVPANGPADD